MDPSAHFDVQRQWFERYRRVILEEAEPITAESVYVVELLLMEAEVDAARAALANLGPPAYDPGEPYFVPDVVYSDLRRKDLAFKSGISQVAMQPFEDGVIEIGNTASNEQFRSVLE